jgi:signal transduction histidine kinase
MNGDRANILLVDDRPENLLALEAVLEPLGQNLVRAASGEEALKRLLTDDFAVILLDVQMPGLDGFDTAAHIKSRDKTRDIPIIFITAINREPHHAMKGYGSGAVDYIAKPFEPWLLQAKVRVFLDLHEKNELLKRQRELLAQRLDERYRAEEALAEKAHELQRSNAELEQFAYVASHDLQEPLQLVSGFLELLVDRHAADLPAEAKGIVDRARRAVSRMDSLIHDLLRYAQVGSAGGANEPVDLGDIADDVVAHLERAIAEAGATVTVGDLPEVEGNRSLLMQLLQNLLANAIKFRRADEPLHVDVTAERSDDEWLIVVRDNGLGVPPGAAERVFAMFERLHSTDEFPGTGIGLAIARKIVERHGGRIWVEASPGGGATFTFTLPAAAP